MIGVPTGIRRYPGRTLPVAPSADGSAGTEWSLQVPRDGPPSFAEKGGLFSWKFMVDMKISGAANSSHMLRMLVIPEVAS